jgi:hypothetical protein
MDGARPVKVTPLVAVLGSLALVLAFGLGRIAGDGKAGEDPTSIESFRAALDEPDWLIRSRKMSAFLDAMGPEDLPEALEAFESRRRFLTDYEIRWFMMAWARFDPKTAYERALVWPERLRRSVAEAAIYAWAFRDPENALVAIRLAGDRELTKQLHAALVAAWSRSGDKLGASDYIATLEPGNERQRYTSRLATEFMMVGPEAVMEWAESVSEEDALYKRSVFQKATIVLATVDGPQAAAWLEGHLEEPHGDASIVFVVRQWARTDPKAAFSWAVQLDPGDQRNRAVGEGYRAWLAVDSEAAEAWLTDALPDESLDQAVRFHVLAQSDEAPERAMNWAQKIQDERLREDLLVAEGQKWVGRDPDRASEWVEQSGLDEEIQLWILKSATPQRGRLPGARVPRRRGS